MAWIAPLVGSVAGPLLGSMFGGSGQQSGPSGGYGSGVPFYTPTGQTAADIGWQNAFSGAQGVTSDVAGTTQPLYKQTLAQQQAINYQPYLSAADQAGQQYGWLSNLAGAQGGVYGQQAGLAGQEQQNLYGAGNQIYQTAFDPQQAQFLQSQQRLQDQVRAGQAARGLGTSPVGAAEENQAMQNFDIAWNTQQLANQLAGLQGLSEASRAGGVQGQLVGANLAGQMGAYGAMPGYTQQSGAIPLQAQQYVAGQPASSAAAYGANMGSNQALYSQLMGNVIPYLNFGQGATNAAFNAYSQQQANQNAAMGGLANNLSQLATAGIQSYNTPGSWLNTTFGGPSGGTQSAYDPYSASNPSYWGATSGDMFGGQSGGYMNPWSIA